jgi:hypothetical protein
MLKGGLVNHMIWCLTFHTSKLCEAVTYLVQEIDENDLLAHATKEVRMEKLQNCMEKCVDIFK